MMLEDQMATLFLSFSFLETFWSADLAWLWIIKRTWVLLSPTQHLIALVLISSDGQMSQKRCCCLISVLSWKGKTFLCDVFCLLLTTITWQCACSPVGDDGRLGFVHVSLWGTAVLHSLSNCWSSCLCVCVCMSERQSVSKGRWRWRRSYGQQLEVAAVPVHATGVAPVPAAARRSRCGQRSTD